MSRPSELPRPEEPTLLPDEAVPDFLDAPGVALLAFLDPGEEASARMRERLSLLANRLADPRLRVGLVDVAHHRLVADALGVDRVPALFVFVAGEVVDRVAGSPPEAILEEMVRARL